MDSLTYRNETIATIAHATAIIGASVAEQSAFLIHLGISLFDTVTLDASVNGGIKEVRQFSNQLLLSPQFGNIRLGVITWAEQLTAEAQNALLKLLEEPPPRVKLILFMQHDGPVLPTVLSRCRNYNADRTSLDIDTKQIDADSLTQFLAAEPLAKQEDLRQTAEAWLQTAYQKWCEAGRPSKNVDEIERLFDFYVQSGGPINKRLIIERLVICSAM
jgi:hypothetical protein